MDGKAPLATREEGEDEVSDLVENFDEASKNEESYIESASGEGTT